MLKKSFLAVRCDFQEKKGENMDDLNVWTYNNTNAFLVAVRN